MRRHKRFLVLGLLIAFMGFGMAMVQPPDNGFKNLKVLPKDISKEDLDKVMDGFKAALGVKCNFCHANSKTEERKLDFASDEKPEKEIARKMMRMTAKIDKKFFNYDFKKDADKAPPVTCITCHRGGPHPSDLEPPKNEEHRGAPRSN